MMPPMANPRPLPLPALIWRSAIRPSTTAARTAIPPVIGQAWRPPVPDPILPMHMKVSITPITSENSDPIARGLVYVGAWWGGCVGSEGRGAGWSRDDDAEGSGEAILAMLRAAG